ncbi:ExbD/TolR family protein [Paraburkholderia sp. 40]|uniref:ExbD/TolR family protein n=1 Tax=Paraburkholderia sp. 40 TaxID=2991059 RepID=UPI003D19AE0D
MRQFPQRKQKQSRIEIIPMIDVMMFLLAFFVLISMNVLPALGLKVALPHSKQTEKVVNQKKITLTIAEDGKTYLDGQLVETAALESRLQGLAGQEQKPTVIIAGDGASRLQNLVDVLDALKKANIPAASIIAKGQ